jgi:hypothetical protein
MKTYVCLSYLAVIGLFKTVLGKVCAEAEETIDDRPVPFHEISILVERTSAVNMRRYTLCCVRREESSFKYWHLHCSSCSYVRN